MGWGELLAGEREVEAVVWKGRKFNVSLTGSIGPGHLVAGDKGARDWRCFGTHGLIFSIPYYYHRISICN